jgi:preprotein translocase subunit Sec63
LTTFFFFFLMQSLTDKETRSNWEKYGNPDGRMEFSVGIALPKWVSSKENSAVVRKALLVFFFSSSFFSSS